MELGVELWHAIHLHGGGAIWLTLFNEKRDNPIYDVDFDIFGEPLLNNTEKIEEF